MTFLVTPWCNMDKIGHNFKFLTILVVSISSQELMIWCWNFLDAPNFVCFVSEFNILKIGNFVLELQIWPKVKKYDPKPVFDNMSTALSSFVLYVFGFFLVLWAQLVLVSPNVTGLTVTFTLSFFSWSWQWYRYFFKLKYCVFLLLFSCCQVSF